VEAPSTDASLAMDVTASLEDDATSVEATASTAVEAASMMTSDASEIRNEISWGEIDREEDDDDDFDNDDRVIIDVEDGAKALEVLVARNSRVVVAMSSEFMV